MNFEQNGCNDLQMLQIKYFKYYNIFTLDDQIESEIDMLDDNKWTPLHHAVAGGHTG